MKKPESVARTGVKALFSGKAESIPGFVNKLTVWFLPLVPHWVIGLIYKRVMRKDKK
ncbi:MAG: hypothetical protein WD048_06125 [Chitinophagales bacterium]